MVVRAEVRIVARARLMVVIRAELKLVAGAEEIAVTRAGETLRCTADGGAGVRFFSLCVPRVKKSREALTSPPVSKRPGCCGKETPAQEQVASAGLEPLSKPKTMKTRARLQNQLEMAEERGVGSPHRVVDLVGSEASSPEEEGG